MQTSSHVYTCSTLSYQNMYVFTVSTRFPTICLPCLNGAPVAIIDLWFQLHEANFVSPKEIHGLNLRSRNTKRWTNHLEHPKRFTIIGWIFVKGAEGNVLDCFGRFNGIILRRFILLRFSIRLLEASKQIRHLTDLSGDDLLSFLSLLWYDNLWIFNPQKVIEQWTKPWLVVWYRGLYYPVI